VENKAVLFSIKPKYVSLIVTGEKTFELRRKCPKICTGDLALVYASSPTMCLVGAFTIGKVIQAPTKELWEKVGEQSGVSFSEFLDYFTDCKVASAIEISHYWSLEQQVPLGLLRSQTQIEPPQSYRYLCKDKTGMLLSSGSSYSA
tara:strand:+ start:3188 stop:3625 length:438 start_codon:yes stop_codon:yes gene_type:complete